MNKLKNIFLDLFLALSVVLMGILVVLNWTYSLNMDEIPTNSKMYTIISKLILKEEDQVISEQLYSAIPSKISIKKDENIHSLIYNDNEISEVYQFIKSSVYKTLYNGEFFEISKIDYDEVLHKQNFIFMEFMLPVSAVIETDYNAYISDIIVTEVNSNIEMYIKSYDRYYKSITKQRYTELKAWNVYNNEYTFAQTVENNSSNPYNLISTNTHSVEAINTRELILTEATQNKIILEFLYNPNLVEKYDNKEEGTDETVFVNQFSRIAISNKNLKFETSETRGNLFYKNKDLTSNEMIGFATGLFDNVHKHINSELRAYPLEIYKKDNDTIVILGAKINSIPYHYDDYAGYFIFNSTGLSYADIKLKEVVTLNKFIMLEPSKFIINTAPKDSNLELIYKDDKPKWIFKSIKEN